MGEGVAKHFKVGDPVQWSSQAQGTHVWKRGHVVQVIPAGALPQGYLEGAAAVHEATPPRDPGSRRDHESYIVLVPNGSRKPKLYWPRVSTLKAWSGEGPGGQF